VIIVNKLPLDKFKMGYVLAYKSNNSLLHRIIVKKQLDNGLSLEAAQIVHVEISGGNQHSVNIAPPFARLIDITKKHAGKHVYVLKYKGEGYEEKKRYKIAYFSAALCANKGYDVPGILSFLYKLIKQSNRLFFCSEGCLMAFQMVYPAALESLKPALCMPGDFLQCDEFERVWEGYIPGKKQTAL